VRALEIVAATADAAFATAEDGRIVTWNDAAVALLGFKPAQVVGRSCYQVLHGTDRAGNQVCCESCPWVRATRQAEPVSDFEMVYRNAQGHGTPLRVSAIVVPVEETDELFVVHLLEPLRSPAGNGRRRRSLGGAGRGGGGGGSRGDDDPPAPADLPSPPPGAARLTPREREVLDLLAAGTRTRDIAARLAISPPTVRNHIQRILRKLGVHSRRDAVAVARRCRLV